MSSMLSGARMWSSERLKASREGGSRHLHELTPTTKIQKWRCSRYERDGGSRRGGSYKSHECLVVSTGGGRVGRRALRVSLTSSCGVRQGARPFRGSAAGERL